MFKTSEITAYTIPSDNVIHQRLLFAYEQTAERVRGDVLETGCGVGKGAELFQGRCESYTAVDKNGELLEYLQKKFPDFNFIEQNIPPLRGLPDESFDTLVTQQVIEHLEDDDLYVRELHRVLRPGGQVILTTPNRKMSLSRNPWHVREYTADELRALLQKYFDEVTLLGVTGDQPVWDYYEQNKKSVEKYRRLDVLDLEHRLPRWLLQVPYDLLNRLNRKQLQESDDALVGKVTTENYQLTEDAETAFDFFCIARKAE